MVIKQGECSSSLVTVVPWCLSALVPTRWCPLALVAWCPGALVLTRLHRWCPVMLLTIPHSLLSKPHHSLPRTFPLLLIVLIPLLLLPTPVNSHARLMEPPSRASMWRLGFDNPPDFNDHQVRKAKTEEKNKNYDHKGLLWWVQPSIWEDGREVWDLWGPRGCLA